MNDRAHFAVEQADQGAGIADVLLFALVPAVGAIAWWRWSHGWGRSGRRAMEEKPSWIGFLGWRGFAIMPVTLALCFAPIIGVISMVDQATGVSPPVWVLIVLFAVFVGLMLWAAKEFWKPSAWRKVPQWLQEFDPKGEGD